MATKEPRTFKTEHRNLPPRARREQDQAEEERRLAAQRESKVAHEVRKAAEEYRATADPNYNAARAKMTPIQFAERVLGDHKLLYLHHGHVFLDGKYATPAMKIAAANSILKRMGLAPIVLVRRT